MENGNHLFMFGLNKRSAAPSRFRVGNSPSRAGNGHVTIGLGRTISPRTGTRNPEKERGRMAVLIGLYGSFVTVTPLLSPVAAMYFHGQSSIIKPDN